MSDTYVVDSVSDTVTECSAPLGLTHRATWFDTQKHPPQASIVPATRNRSSIAASVSPSAAPT